MKFNPPSWLYRRTRILNILHLFGVAMPHTQLNKDEMICLAKHANNRRNALEIGTYMGVSASIIAKALADKGVLNCVDPFVSNNNKLHPGLQIAVRELKRNKVLYKIKFLLGFSNDIEIINQIPRNLDFIFIDGDHSYEGIDNDWKIVLDKLALNGVVCLHDTTIPEQEPHRDFGSVSYFNKVIKNDNNFVHIETVYSMNVLVKK